MSETRLALRPREAAKLLSISERTLWGLTAPRGPIPCKRLHGAVLYSVSALQAWLDGSLPEAAPLAKEGGAQ